MSTYRLSNTEREALAHVNVDPIGRFERAVTGEELMASNPYRPWPARITSITELTPNEKLFEFRFIDERIRQAFRHLSGVLGLNLIHQDPGIHRLQFLILHEFREGAFQPHGQPCARAD